MTDQPVSKAACGNFLTFKAGTGAAQGAEALMKDFSNLHLKYGSKVIAQDVVEPASL